MCKLNTGGNILYDTLSGKLECEIYGDILSNTINWTCHKIRQNKTFYIVQCGLLGVKAYWK
jgi:hypothetical protein